MTNKKHCLLFIVNNKMHFTHLKRLFVNDTNNGLQLIKDIKKLSTPLNYDVDNMVQSDLMNKSEANVEIKSTTKDTQLNTKNMRINFSKYRKLILACDFKKYCQNTLLNKQLKNYV